MEKSIINFLFDYLKISLILIKNYELHPDITTTNDHGLLHSISKDLALDGLEYLVLILRTWHRKKTSSVKNPSSSVISRGNIF